MELTTILVRREAELMRVTLNRPERANAINGVMLGDLHRALDIAEADPQRRIVVLQGQGGTFCTGMDFSDTTGSAQQFYTLLERFTTIPRTIVALVDGRVAAGGVGLVAAADLVYATARSTFGLPESLWGLLPCCVMPFLIRRVGFQPAYAMTLSTVPVSAEQAHRSHLADEVADDPEPLLRRLRSRMTKVDTTTVGDLKAYARRMWIVSTETERAAVDEFARLVASPVVRSRMEGFAANQAFPWENRS